MKLRGYVVLLAVLVITSIFSAKGALQDTHWDAPIYLERGRELAQTSYLHDYARHAGEIARRLPELTLGEDTPYWGFMRLGNTMLLGAITYVMGASLTSIQVAFWLYGLILATALAFGFVLSLRIVHIFEPSLPRKAVTAGALLSAALYLSSDIYRHLSGIFISEVPAMLLLAASAYSLVRANESRRIPWALLSGVLGFALYVVKMEAIWAYISFGLVFAIVLLLNTRQKVWWPAFLVAGFFSAALYAVYSWWYWPLTDPRLFLIFAEVHRIEARSPVIPVNWFVAGGLLWLGLAAALRYCFRSSVLWLALGWLAMLFLPYVDSALNGGIGQARMFTLIMPPLLLASTIGFAQLFARMNRHETSGLTFSLLFIAVFALAVVSHAETYQRLRELPGGWRLQHLKPFLSPAPYERVDYPLKDLALISRHLYSDGRPVVLIRGEKVPEEYLNIISYLGPQITHSSIERFMPSGTLEKCENRMKPPFQERVMFCKDAPEEQALASLSSTDTQIVYLLPANRAQWALDPGAGAIVFETQKLVLLSANPTR